MTILKLSGQMKELKICPICHKTYDTHSAISRKDNKTEICSECGTREALEEFFNWKGGNEYDET